jgi:hypothetical protein
MGTQPWEISPWMPALMAFCPIFLGAITVYAAVRVVTRRGVPRWLVPCWLLNVALLYCMAMGSSSVPGGRPRRENLPDDQEPEEGGRQQTEDGEDDRNGRPPGA